MFNLTGTQNLTQMRNVYVEGLLESMVSKAAVDIHSGNTTREVAFPALVRIVSGTIPNTGRGHAAAIKAQVNEALDAAMVGLVIGEPPLQEEQPEAPKSRAKGSKADT